MAADLRHVPDALPASGRQHGAAQTDPLLHHPPLPRLPLLILIQDRLGTIRRSVAEQWWYLFSEIRNINFLKN